MKRWILWSCLSLIITGSIEANENFSQQSEEQMFYLSHLSQEDIQRCLEQPSSILICPEGTHLPLSFLLKGDLLELLPADNSLTLRIKRTFYLSFQNQQILISLNGTDWKTWPEFFTGVITVHLDVPSNTPRLQLGAELSLRSCQIDN